MAVQKFSVRGLKVEDNDMGCSEVASMSNHWTAVAILFEYLHDTRLSLILMGSGGSCRN